MSDRVEQARQIDRRVEELRQNRNTTEFELARLLLEMNQDRRYTILGFANVKNYALDRLGYTAEKTRQALEMAARLSTLPVMEKACREGTIDWTKAREASVVAERDPSREAALTEAAQKLSTQDLRKVLRSHAPDAPAPEGDTAEVVRIVLQFSPEEMAVIQSALDLVRSQTEGTLDRSQLVVEAMRRLLAGGASSTSSYRVNLTRCESCGKTRNGDVTVPKAEAEQILCNAEVADLRNGAEQVKVRRVRRKIAAFIVGRDGGRCRVPGCGNAAFVEMHHEHGWRNGHDPETMYLLCSSHHHARHRGDLSVRMEKDGPHFFRPDGTQIVALRSADVEYAVSALSKLDIEPGAARWLLLAAMCKEPGRSWTGEDLLMEALQATS